MILEQWADDYGIPAEWLADLCARLGHLPEQTLPELKGRAENYVQNAVRIASAVRRPDESFYWLGRNNNGAYDEDHPPSPGTRWGLGNDSKKLNDVCKSSDLIGYYSTFVTPEMVGKRVAIFTAVECKADGWKLTTGDKRAQAQNRFGQMVIAAGGLFCFSTGQLPK